MKISIVNKYAKNPFILALMIVSILSSSFMSVQAVSPTNNTNISKDDLFNAIYFLEGDIVQEIPALAKLRSYAKESKTRDELQTMNRMSALVDEMDANFKTKLQKAVNSKDQYTISETLQEGADLVLLAAAVTIDHSAIDNFPNLRGYDLTDAKERAQASAKLKSYYASNPQIQSEYGRAACALLAIAVAVAVALFVYFWVETPEAASNPDSVLNVLSKDKSLNHERLVEQLAQLK